MALRDPVCFDMSSEAFYVHCEVYAQVELQEEACSPYTRVYPDMQFTGICRIRVRASSPKWWWGINTLYHGNGNASGIII